MNFGALTNSHTGYLFGHLGGMDPQKADLLQKPLFRPKTTFVRFFAFWSQKYVFGANSHFCVPVSRMLIKPMEFQCKWSPFWPKRDFGPKSAFWAPKSVFGPKMRKMVQNCIFGPKSAFFAKVTKKLTMASAFRKENRDSRIRAQTASTGARGSENL